MCASRKTTDFASGWEEMDRQHGALVESFAFLEGAPRRRDADLPELDRIIAEMVEHFRWEEDRMRESGYPDLSRHADDHKRQVANLRDIRHLVADGDESLDMDFFHACQAWNVRHIRGQDLDFALFLRDRECWDLRRELVEWDLGLKMDLLPG